MMYPYIILADETEITHSHIMEKDKIKEVEVHFEDLQMMALIQPDARYQLING